MISYILYDSNYMTFWKTMETVKRSVVAKWAGRDKQVNHKKIFRAIKIYCMILWWIHVIIHFSKCIEFTKPRVNPNRNWTLGNCNVSM